jgi:hypothetical protein
MTERREVAGWGGWKVEAADTEGRTGDTTNKEEE